MISYILLFSILLLVLLLNRRTKERYLNYKGVVITPNKNVYIQPKIYYKNGIMVSDQISKVLSSNLPLKRVSMEYTHFFLLQNTKINSIVISTLYDYLMYNSINKNNNIRFISKLFKQKLTIVTNSKLSKLSEYNGETIYVNNKTSSEYFIMYLLKDYYKFNIKFLTDIENKDNKKYNIDEYYYKKYKNISICYLTNHPNLNLVKLIKNNSNINIVAIDKYDRKIMNNLIPDFDEDKIDSNLYYKYRTDMISTICNPIIIVTHKDTNDNIVYKINSFIYNSFNMFKITNNDNLKNSVKYYNLSDTYFNNQEFYNIHSGTYKFYLKHGFISFNDTNICRKYVSIKFCDLSDGIRLNPYRLL